MRPLSRPHAESDDLTCKQRRDIRPFIQFTFEGEVFDSFHYASELAAAYQSIYLLFEANPLNFKTLDKGMLHIKLKHSGMSFVFDSLAEGQTSRNTKVFAFIGEKFSSARVTDRETLDLRIFIRKSTLISASADTMDFPKAGNRFKYKSSENFILSGKKLGHTPSLLSYAALFQPVSALSSLTYEEIYFNVSKEAYFPGGSEKFREYLEEHFYLSEESHQIWSEGSFDYNISFKFRVNEYGVMDSLYLLSFYPKYDYKSRYYDLVCKELKRCIIRKYKWMPKQVGLKKIYTYYAMTLKGRRRD